MKKKHLCLAIGLASFAFTSVASAAVLSGNNQSSAISISSANTTNLPSSAVVLSLGQRDIISSTAAVLADRESVSTISTYTGTLDSVTLIKSASSFNKSGSVIARANPKENPPQLVASSSPLTGDLGGNSGGIFSIEQGQTNAPPIPGTSTVILRSGSLNDITEP